MDRSHPRDLITHRLEEIHRLASDRTEGEVATYIPELATANPDLFGMAVATRGGGVYVAGDADHPFTLQSVSKPFVYAMALSELGLDAVLARVGGEPSGETFNAISLEPGTGRPANPMINAGAIVTSSLIAASGPSDRFERIREALSGFAGRPLEVDEAVYHSELETGDKNRALAYLMRNAGSLRADVDQALDVYFRQCALLVTARDIAVMAATLANGGVNPVTGKAVVSDTVASQVLTVMATCGMYDYSGEWLLHVGLPAKSGVSGAVVAASPAQFGLGLFSPRLDARGNSVRAIAACRELAKRFDMHLMRQPNRSTSPQWLAGTAARLASEAVRPNEHREALRSRGDAITVRGLHGDVAFADAETLIRSLDEHLERPRVNHPSWVVLDLTRVRTMCSAAAAMVAALGQELASDGVTVAVAASDNSLVPTATTFPSLEVALRWCEDELLDTGKAYGT